MDVVDLRVASFEDADRIAPVHRTCWHEAYSGLVPQRCLDDLDAQDRVAVWQRRLEEPGHRTTIALQGGHVVGLATVAPTTAPCIYPPVELRSLYVVRDMWGRGIGRALLREALADGPAALWVFEGNDRARRFYAKTGWRATGDRHVDEWTAIPELRLVRGSARSSNEV